MSKRTIISSLIVFLFLVDRISKYLALLYLQNGNFCCSNQLGLKLLHNPGIAFGLPLPVLISLGVSLIIIFFLIYTLVNKWRTFSSLQIASLELIIIGALSNIIDRIKYQSVIDFIHLGKWPVFNLADVYIIAGILIILFIELKKNKPAKTEQ